MRKLGLGVSCAGLSLVMAAPITSAAAANSEDDSTLYGTVAASYTTGKYGTRQSTEVSTLTPSLDWSVLTHTTLSASIPFVLQTAPRGTIGGGGGNGGNGHRGNNRGVQSPEVTTSGLGDIVLGIDQDLLTQSKVVPVEAGIFGDVKLGTADVSKGLGSGQNDYSFGGRVGHEWTRFYLSGELGYTVVGNPGTVTANGVTTTLRYHNAAFGGVKGTYTLNDRVTLGAGLDITQSYERGLADSEIVNLNAAYHLNRRLTFKGEVLTGLTNDSPDFGVRASVGLAL